MVSLTLLILVGCQSNSKKVEPVEAAETYINSYMYQKDSDKMKETFDLEPTSLETQSEKNFVANFKKLLDLDDTSNDKLNELYQKYQVSIHNNTSYKAKLINDDKKNPIIELSIIGLNEPEDTWMDTAISKKLDENPDLITASMDESAIKKVSQTLQLDLLFESVKESTPKKESVQLNMLLEENPKNKNTWQIKDEKNFLDDLNTAFGL